MDFRNSVNNFFYNLFDFLNFLDNSFDRHNLFPESLNFNNSVLNVRNNFLHFFDPFLNDNVINKFLNFNNLDLFLFYRDNLFPEFINLFDFSVNNLNWNHFFDNSVNWNLNLHWYDDVSGDLNDLWLFDNICDDLLYFQSSGNFSILHHNSLRNHFLNLRVLLVNFISHQDFSYHINWPFNFQVNISRGINFNVSFLENREIDNPFNFNNLRYRNNFFYNFLYDLRHFDDFLDYSWHNDYFFDNSFDLNDLWNFNKFLDNFLNNCWDSFDSFNDFFNRNDSFFNDSDDFGFFNKVIDDFFDFFNSVLIKNLRYLNFNLLMNDSFNNFDNWLFDDFLLNFDNFVNDGYLNNFLYNFFNCPVLNNGLFNNSFNFFDLISVNNFLDNDFHFNWLLNYVMNLNNFLYNSWNFNYLLNDLDNWNNFLYYPVNRLISDLDVVSNVWSWNILDSLNDLFNNFLNFNDF